MPGIVILAGSSPSTWVIANALRKDDPDLALVVEEREPRSVFLRRRLRRLGALSTAGQVLFQVYGRAAERRAEGRRRRILAEAGLDDTPPEGSGVHRVASANDERARSLIVSMAPEVVVVNGTRILSGALLGALSCPVINVHAGITPAYRGVHGGYWALAAGDRRNCGVTVHLVDPGVDTGAVIAQARVEPGPEDNFFTYPALQLAAAVPLLRDAVRAARAGALRTRPSEGRSRQWYHPTLWGYWATGLRKGVW